MHRQRLEFVHENRSPKRIAILGGYGFDNLGDDLILSAALARLRRTIKDAQIKVLSSDPIETRARHEGVVVYFSAEALVRQFIIRFLIPFSKPHRKYVLAVPRNSHLTTFKGLWRADLVVSLGGGYLNDYSKFLTHLRFLELIFVGLLWKPLLLYSHGIGPLQRRTLRILARFAFKFVSYATVRDRASLKLLSELGFPKLKAAITADESWVGGPQESLRQNPLGDKKSNNLAISLMPLQEVTNLPFGSFGRAVIDAEQANQQVLSGIVTSIEQPDLKVRRIFFFSMRSQDTGMALRLQSLIGSQIPVEILDDTDSQYRALARSRVLIAMRAHPIIMAAQMNVPTIAISIFPKVRDLMIDLGTNRHAATTYLSARTVLRSILWAWCRAFPPATAKPAQCSAVEAAGDI